MDVIFDWKRYWLPVNENSSIQLSRDGFLVPPDKYNNPDLRTLEELRENECLILIGEPGIGKSKVFEILEKEKAKNELFLSLSHIKNSDDIEKEVIKPVKKKLKKHNIVYLFLDSLDEGRLNFKGISEIFVRKLKKLKKSKDKLRIRITCRTRELPSSLNKGLSKFYEKDKESDDKSHILTQSDANANVHISDSTFKYELQPLTQDDVKEAALKNGVDPNEFIKEIKEKQAIPFAIRPITLKFILDIYKENRGLPTEIKDLYLKGIEKLCTESNIKRVEGELEDDSKLNQGEKLIIAARIAGLSKFCNYTAIEKNNLGRNNDVLKFSQIYGYSEDFKGNEIDVNQEEIREVLSTALFTFYGNDLMCWAHNSYAEFLAAYYLHINRTPIDQIENIIFQDLYDEKKIIPQLQEVAFWLCHFNKDFLSLVIEYDCSILLDRASHLLSDEQKNEIIDSYVKLLEEGKEYMSFNDSFKSLIYEGIEDRIVINLEKKCSDTTKQFYLKLAKNFDAKEIQNSILKLALDFKEVVYIREEALRYLDLNGDKNVKQNLIKALNEKYFKNDNEDVLRGLLLSILWREFISIKELVNYIKDPKSPGSWNVYRYFWRDEFIEKLEVDDLPVTLEYAKEIDIYNDSNLKDLFWKVLDKGIENIEKNEIAEKVVEVILFNSKKAYSEIDLYKYFWNESENKLSKNLNKKKIFLKNVIAQLIDAGENEIIRISEFSFHYYKRWRVLDESDVEWLFEELMLARNKNEKLYWTHLISNLFHPYNSISCCCSKIIDYLELYRKACEKPDLSVFREKYRFLFEGVDIYSKEIVKIRNDHYKVESWIREQDEKREKEKIDKEKCEKKVEQSYIDFENDFPSNLSKNIDIYESGNKDSWTDITHAFIVSRKTNREWRYYPSISVTDRWKFLDESQKEVIINIAFDYLLNRSNICTECGKNVYCKFLTCAFVAVKLIYDEKHELLDEFENYNLWNKWGHSILFYPDFRFNKDEREVHKILINNLYEITPALVQDLSKKKFDDSLADFSEFEIYFDKINHLNDEVINDYFHSILDSVSEDHYLFLVKYLVNIGHQRTIIKIEDFIVKKDCIEKEVRGIVLLLELNSQKYFQQIFTRIQTDKLFAEYFIDENIKSGRRRPLPLDREYDEILRALDEETLSDWYVFLYKMYPLKSRSELTLGLSQYTKDDGLRDYQSAVLGELQYRKTIKSIECLEKIQNELQDHGKNLRLQIYQAKRAINFHSWKPIDARDFYEVVKKHKFIIQSESQLLNVVYKVLENYQKDLSTTGNELIESFWNNITNKCRRPKKEDEISNLVKRYIERKLTKDGIITNREVEVNTKGKAKGDKTDIHIDTVYEGKRFSVIIEAKGSWNDDIKSNMKNQLVGQYLNNTPCNNGIYLIYYILDAKIDKRSSAYKGSIKKSILEYEKLYNQQAQELSNGPYQIKSFVLDCTFENMKFK